MTKYILGVAYSHVLLNTAHISVGGQTKQLALQRAKRLGSVLTKRMPGDFNLHVPREGDTVDGTCIYVVCVTMDTHLDEAKALISELVLRGSV